MRWKLPGPLADLLEAEPLAAVDGARESGKRAVVIFRDPMHGITLPQIERLPVPIPTDRLRGLVDRADTNDGEREC